MAHINSSAGNADWEIIAVDNLIVGGERWGAGNKKNVQFIQHNCIESLDGIIEKDFDYIIHAAGIASPAYYRKFPLETLEVATTGLKNSLELCRRNPKARLLFFSSSEIYGDPDQRHVPTPESYKGNVACLGPRACYDMSKRLGETLVQIYHEQFGVHGVIVRPFNVYGPGMLATDYRVLPNFAHRIKQKKPLQVYGEGSQTRTFCYITDAMRGFILALVRGVKGQPYNIGTDHGELSMGDLARLVSAVAKHSHGIDVIEYPDSYPADEPNRRCPDLTKSRTQLGYVPRVELKEGLKRFFEWADRNYT